MKNNEVNKNSPPDNTGGVSAGRGGNKNPHQINNLPHLKPYRQNLRNDLTSAEAYFWSIIKNSQLDGKKFRRQHSVGKYILDFYCREERIAVELDGEVHMSSLAAELDNERDTFLAGRKIKVLRFENEYVFKNTERVLDEIRQHFGWLSKNQPPDPS